MTMMPAVLKQISDNLKTPAYQLLFGVCVVFLGTGFLTAGAGALSGDLRCLIAAGVCFALALAAVVLVVKEVERNKQSAQEADAAPPPPGERHPLKGLMNLSPAGKELSDTLLAVAENVLEAARRGGNTMAELVGEELVRLRATSRAWRSGEIEFSGARSNQVLLRMYEGAERSIFATAVPEYHAKVLLTAFGAELLAIHRRSKAQVTRIFVFNDRSEINVEVVATMTAHAKDGIRVRAYFDEEDQYFTFTPDLSKDFTVIDDGEAIGVTKAVTDDGPISTWYLCDADQRGAIRNAMENLLRCSVGLSDLQKWWDERRAAETAKAAEGQAPAAPASTGVAEQGVAKGEALSGLPESALRS